MYKERGNGTAAELLADWRAAGRDTAAAKAAAEVADLAVVTARTANEAASEAEVAANVTAEAAQRALEASASAKRAAASVSDAAQQFLSIAEGDKVRADHAVEQAEAAEKDAGDRFHEAQQRGFARG